MIQKFNWVQNKDVSWQPFALSPNGCNGEGCPLCGSVKAWQDATLVQPLNLQFLLKLRSWANTFTLYEEILVIHVCQEFAHVILGLLSRRKETVTVSQLQWWSNCQRMRLWLSEKSASHSSCVQNPRLVRREFPPGLYARQQRRLGSVAASVMETSRKRLTKKDLSDYIASGCKPRSTWK